MKDHESKLSSKLSCIFMSSGLKRLKAWHQQDPGSEAGGGTLSVGVAYNCGVPELLSFELKLR